MQEKKLLTIDQLAGLAGVPKHFVVHATQVGLITPASHSKAGYRLYGADQVQELAFIQQMYSLGFYANQVRELKGLKNLEIPMVEKEAVFASVFDRYVECLRERTT